MKKGKAEVKTGIWDESGITPFNIFYMRATELYTVYETIFENTKMTYFILEKIFREQKMDDEPWMTNQIEYFSESVAKVVVGKTFEEEQAIIPDFYAVEWIEPLTEIPVV